jgi:hypothetical protein
MLYTIGKTDRYREGIEKWGESYMKLGKNSPKAKTMNYTGGIIFETKKQAEAYLVTYNLNNTHTVFGVDAKLGIDTEPSKNGPWHCLINSCKVMNVESESTYDSI